MAKTTGVWEGDWRKKVLNRVEELGFQSITDFLNSYSRETYVDLAKRLGPDIAGLQIIRLQNEAAKTDEAFRLLAMDALPRELNWHLPDGWRHGAEGDFDTASTFAFWMTRLKLELSPKLEDRAKSVWKALKELDPPMGWSPGGPDDTFITQAFSKGWPLLP